MGSERGRASKVVVSLAEGSYERRNGQRKENQGGLHPTYKILDGGLERLQVLLVSFSLLLADLGLASLLRFRRPTGDTRMGGHCSKC